MPGAVERTRPRVDFVHSFVIASPLQVFVQPSTCSAGADCDHGGQCLVCSQREPFKQSLAGFQGAGDGGYLASTWADHVRASRGFTH